jgi:hypothetical protein
VFIPPGQVIPSVVLPDFQLKLLRLTIPLALTPEIGPIGPNPVPVSKEFQ